MLNVYPGSLYRYIFIVCFHAFEDGRLCLHRPLGNQVVHVQIRQRLEDALSGPK